MAEARTLEIRESSPQLAMGTRQGDQSRGTSLLRPGVHEMHGHRIPASQYVALGWWMVLLFIQYGIIRCMCYVGIPNNCEPHTDIVAVMGELQYIIFAGFVLAVLTGVHWPDRFLYLFSMGKPHLRGLLFYSTFFVSGIGWGSLMLIPGLRDFTLTSALVGTLYGLPLLMLVSGFLFGIGWHFWTAFRHNSRSGFVAYLLSRCAVIAFFSGYLIIKLQHPELDFHLHHSYVGFIAASLAEFNHPMSTVLLACGTGVFVQGTAAYHAAPIVSHLEKRIIYPYNGSQVYSPLVSEEAVGFFLRHTRYVP